MYKSAGPRLSADLGIHTTCPADEPEGWTEPEKEERRESPPSSPLVTDVKETPQLPMNGMMGCNAE